MRLLADDPEVCGRAWRCLHCWSAANARSPQTGFLSLTTTDAATHASGAFSARQCSAATLRPQVTQATLATVGLTAEGIVSKANVERDNGTLTRNARGTRLLEPRLDGTDIRDTLQPGVTQDIPTVAQAWTAISGRRFLRLSQGQGVAPVLLTALMPFEPVARWPGRR